MIDAEFAKAWGLNQVNFKPFIDATNDWDEEDKICFVLAVGECGYSFDAENVDPTEFDVAIYRVHSMRDLAIEFVDDGLFGEVPEPFQFYIDYDAIALDLAIDYSEATIAGERLIFHCN